MTINGWRRLGLVFVGTWVLGCAGVAIYEVLPTERSFLRGTFVSHSIPEGTLFSDDGTITLPNGKVIHVETNDKYDKIAKELGGTRDGGAAINPWDVDWSKYPEATSTEFRFGKFLVIAAVAPVVLWLILEAVVALARWVRSGFRSGGPA